MTAFSAEAGIGSSRPPAFPAPALPPHNNTPTPATNRGEFIRQHQQSDRNHPETENRQEAEQSEDDKNDPNGDPERARTRHGEIPAKYGNLPRCRVALMLSRHMRASRLRQCRASPRSRCLYDEAITQLPEERIKSRKNPKWRFAKRKWVCYRHPVLARAAIPR